MVFLHIWNTEPDTKITQINFVQNFVKIILVLKKRKKKKNFLKILR